jgi:soluble lytic murein transglycosylase-like protein
MKPFAKLCLVCLMFGAFAGAAAAAELAVLSNGFTIRHERRQIIGQITRLYLSTGRNSYVDIPTVQILAFQKDDTPAPPASASSADFLSAVAAASDKHQLDSDFITSVIHAESGFNSHAVSRKGAQGLMQLMPQTASRLGVSNPFDPIANVDGGTRYLRQLLDYYHDDMAKALAAYNAGPRRVSQYHGVPPYHETHAYVGRIIREYNRKKLAAHRAHPQTSGVEATNRTASAPR